MAKRIEDGEQVTVTRHGAAFATLAPARSEAPGGADWAGRLKRRPPLGRRLSEDETRALHDETRALHDEMRGRL